MALRGIDISGWKKGINLSEVPSDFVIVKATEWTGFNLFQGIPQNPALSFLLL